MIQSTALNCLYSDLNFISILRIIAVDINFFFGGVEHFALILGPIYFG